MRDNDNNKPNRMQCNSNLKEEKLNENNKYITEV